MIGNEMDVPHYHCGDCIHWAFRDPCKRLDHDRIKFAIPWFKSYDGGQHAGVVCCEFVPRRGHYKENYWTNFEDYWKNYVEQWLPYQNTNTFLYFTLHGDTSVRYGVPLMTYVNGTMVDDGKLLAVEKMYHKRTRKGFGYELVREQINGVMIERGEGLVLSGLCGDAK